MDNDIKYWLAFNTFFLIGPKKFSLLVKYFGSARKAWEATDHEIQEINLGQKTTGKFLLFRKTFNLQQYLRELQEKKIQVITLNDKDYPKLLKEIAEPPYVLYVKSAIPLDRLFRKPCIAIVGTRNITSYGRVVTQRITEGLVDCGLTIVSGLARGVDVCAHETALESQGLTIAVLGSGIDQIYPAQNVPVAKKIIQKGALISEFPLGMRAYPGNFPIRNRIISGLSLGVVVTEAAEKSGTLITASYAADQGREVFAIPGPITSPLSAGTSALLKKGAKLVTNVSDIIEELPSLRGSDPRVGKLCMPGIQVSDPSITAEERKILDFLFKGPLSLDELVRISKLPAGTVLSLITVMELKGVLVKTGDIVYSKIYSQK